MGIKAVLVILGIYDMLGGFALLWAYDNLWQLVGVLAILVGGAAILESFDEQQPH